MEKIEVKLPEIKKEVTYSWTLYPGKKFAVKDALYGEEERWHPVEVDSEHEVIVGRGNLRTAKGGGKIGYGVIKEIKGNSFFSGQILVSVGKEARIFFKKKHHFDQPKVPNFPRIPKDVKVDKEPRVSFKKKHHFDQLEIPNFSIPKDK
jgi:hypothetical protein